MIGIYNLINDDIRFPKLNLLCSYKNNNEISSISETVEILNKKVSLNKLSNENVYLATYNANGSLLGLFLISVGSNKNSTIDYKVINTYLALSGADSYLLIHNHPTEILKESQDDVDVFNSLSLMFFQVGYNLVDSVIVTKDGWHSIKTGDYYYDKEIF